MSERILKKDGSDARWCDTCKCELAASECTDAWQMPDGSWEYRGLKRGCLKHPVTQMVHLADGRVMTFEEYCNAN